MYLFKIFGCVVTYVNFVKFGNSFYLSLLQIDAKTSYIDMENRKIKEKKTNNLITVAFLARLLLSLKV